MSSPEPGISEDVVGAVVRVLRDLGFDPAAAAASVGTIVPGRRADDMIERAAAHLNDDAIGITLAQRIPLGSLGPVDYGLTTHSTLREALDVVCRYYGVATQRVRLELVEQPPKAWLVSHRTPIEHSRHWGEFAFAVIAIRIRATLDRPELVFDPVSFQHPEPPHREAIDAFFKTRVQFGAAEEVLGFPHELLEEPLLTASKPLAELLVRRMSELEPALATDTLLDRVRRTLAAMLADGVTDLATLAQRLGESTRTLQRALHDRGTSHSELLDELRRSRAALLLDQGLRVAEVARQLGFSEPSAFFRAYRRWTGTSPKSGR